MLPENIPVRMPYVNNNPPNELTKDDRMNPTAIMTWPHIVVARKPNNLLGALTNKPV